MATNSVRIRGPHVRSLYWRAVAGFSGCIAAVLIIQAAAVVVSLERTPDSQQLRAFTQHVASDMAQPLTVDPRLDVQRYIDEHYPSPFASLYITLADGRIILRGPLLPPRSAVEGGKEFYRL